VCVCDMITNLEANSQDQTHYFRDLWNAMQLSTLELKNTGTQRKS